MTDKIRAALATCLEALTTLEREGETRFPETVAAAANAARAALAEPEAVSTDEWVAFLAWRDDYSRHSDPCAWPAWQARSAWSNRSTTQQWPRPDDAEKVEPARSKEHDMHEDLIKRLRNYVSPQWGSALKDCREAANALEAMQVADPKPVAPLAMVKVFGCYDSAQIPLDVRGVYQIDAFTTGVYVNMPSGAAAPIATAKTAELRDAEIDAISRATSPVADAAMLYVERQALWERTFARAVIAADRALRGEKA